MFPEVFGRLRANVIGMHKSADSALVSEFEAPLGGGVKPSQGTGTSFVILAATTTMSTVAQWAKTKRKPKLVEIIFHLKITRDRLVIASACANLNMCPI